MSIDREHISELEKRCEYGKREKRKFEDQAYREQPGSKRDGLLGQAKQVSLVPCHTINNYRIDHEEYMRELAYYR